jgi:DNA-binding CsgD family transcriptional regulator
MVVTAPGRSQARRESASTKLVYPATAAPDPIGFLLTDLSFKPVYANGAAIRILTYPIESTELANSIGLVQQRIRSAFRAESYAAELMAPIPFQSGTRHYLCRPFLLDSWRGKTDKSMVGFLLARHAREPVDISEASGRFHLSPRERETIQHLINGLTTKEIATRMNVSPNTIKQFIRLIMSKMGVTTRLAMVRKILSN